MPTDMLISPVGWNGGYRQSEIDSAGYSGLARRSLLGYRRIRPVVQAVINLVVVPVIYERAKSVGGPRQFTKSNRD